MKILVTSIIDPKKSAPNRLHHFLDYLSKSHDVTVICINDSWKSKTVNTNKFYKDFHKSLEKVEILYLSSYNISPFFQELFSRFLIKSLSNKQFDVIFNYNTLISGYSIAKKIQIPMVYDLADDLPEMVAYSPQISSFFRKIGKFVANEMIKKTISRSTKVTAISKTIQIALSIPEEKFVLVNNGVNTALFQKIVSDVRMKMGIGNNFLLGYIGVLREWVELKPVYDAIKNFDNVQLMIIGEEGLFKENVEMTKKMGVENKIFFIGTLPYEMIPQYIAAMDCCLIPFNNCKISQNSVPLKLFEYMACEKPIISTRLPGVMEIAGNRISYADTSKEYEEQIKLLFAKKDETNSHNNREFVFKTYDWNIICQKLEKTLIEAL